MWYGRWRSDAGWYWQLLSVFYVSSSVLVPFRLSLVIQGGHLYWRLCVAAFGGDCVYVAAACLLRANCFATPTWCLNVARVCNCSKIPVLYMGILQPSAFATCLYVNVLLRPFAFGGGAACVWALSVTICMPWWPTVFFLASDYGMVNFYRCFVSDASKIIAPLNDLLKESNNENTPIQWSEAAEEASKQDFTNVTLLALPKMDASIFFFPLSFLYCSLWGDVIL